MTLTILLAVVICYLMIGLFIWGIGMMDMMDDPRMWDDVTVWIFIKGSSVIIFGWLVCLVWAIGSIIMNSETKIRK